MTNLKQMQREGREEMPCPDSQCNNMGMTAGGENPQTGEQEPLQCEFCCRRDQHTANVWKAAQEAANKSWKEDPVTIQHHKEITKQAVSDALNLILESGLLEEMDVHNGTDYYEGEFEGHNNLARDIKEFMSNMNSV